MAYNGGIGARGKGAKRAPIGANEKRKNARSAEFKVFPLRGLTRKGFLGRLLQKEP